MSQTPLQETKTYLKGGKIAVLALKARQNK